MTNIPGQDDVKVTDNLTVPGRILRFTFSRSSGPGGQNVNKVSTRATLTVSLYELMQFLNDGWLARLRDAAQHHLINAELVFNCGESRSQTANRQACIDKLVQLLQASRMPPRKRRKTKVSRGALARRRDKKQQHSEKKSRRRGGEF